MCTIDPDNASIDPSNVTMYQNGNKALIQHIIFAQSCHIDCGSEINLTRLVIGGST